MPCLFNLCCFKVNDLELHFRLKILQKSSYIGLKTVVSLLASSINLASLKRDLRIARYSDHCACLCASLFVKNVRIVRIYAIFYCV